MGFHRLTVYTPLSMRELYMKAHRILLLVLFLAVLGACGQKGDLYLPDEAEEASQQTERQTEK